MSSLDDALAAAQAERAAAEAEANRREIIDAAHRKDVDVFVAAAAEAAALLRRESVPTAPVFVITSRNDWQGTSIEKATHSGHSGWRLDPYQAFVLLEDGRFGDAYFRTRTRRRTYRGRDLDRFGVTVGSVFASVTDQDWRWWGAEYFRGREPRIGKHNSDSDFEAMAFLGEGVLRLTSR